MTWSGTPRELGEFSTTITFQDVADLETDHFFLDFAMRYAFYAALAATVLMIMALVVKLMWNCNCIQPAEDAAVVVTERSRLVLCKEDGESGQYGTSRTTDMESGGISSSSSSEDLYDGKICVICYDDVRNCFFIPCGHCITCHACAHKILKHESKSCPICRGIIDKVRTLHIS